MQTHEPHFEFMVNLVNSVYEKTNITELGIKIYCVFDNEKCISEFKNRFPDVVEKIIFINIENIFSQNLNENLIREAESFNYQNCEKSDFYWGHKADANYAAVKRSYSILYLESIGYEYVWPLDAESLVLSKVDLTEIIEFNTRKPTLWVGSKKIRKRHRKKHQSKILDKLFGYTGVLYPDNEVRQSDFWIISTSYFLKMMIELTNKYQKPVSYFINGGEILVYEWFLYYQYEKCNCDDIEIIKLDGSLNGNTMLQEAIKNESINLISFANELNTLYFNKTLSYRGDILKWPEFKTKRGKELLKLLNIKIAVSNWQGNEGWLPEEELD